MIEVGAMKKVGGETDEIDEKKRVRAKKRFLSERYGLQRGRRVRARKTRFRASDIN